jgi:hypothetical protein
MISTQIRLSAWALILATAFTAAGCIVEDADDSAVPEFDCSDRDAMLPNTTLIRNMGTETRTFTGQFGNPENGHSITFTLVYDNINGDTFRSVGAVTDYGRTSITVQFDVSDASCDTGDMTDRHDCDVPYRLVVMVDGEPYCSENDYGNIHTYWRGGGGF